ncbi:ATP phosphoribosyltransferase [Methylobacterium radiotolerans]|uniref:ATP phosphoribosyltransferase n=1 Tax=Methylobacterium radiotolerans TaxID=31998 RepID=UPI000734FF7F|nr:MULTISPECIES: ATP phosphoribosyltransferase [Methylobacterium]KTS08186.1 ATP phosphoribosyltransferase [Methylobacterium radiotolerans]KTS49735.1 ATP phosphoribosyltransferase [Methylobacterium radiotolerans]KZC02967.1 ATP phosphoribosyltransferase [Methylobacterium radiotolerans]MDE3744776.1 ATP phosphoribosyltransferase [Methylobacterium radiotolerans]PVZ03598.1 ATP phosphoribosyltransferase [Methylobacterium organophilum]
MSASDAASMPLILAVPSKGRLQENASAFFGRAGLKLAQGAGARDYRGKLIGVPDVEVRYLSASEIAAQLASGAAHLGVTGEDLIRETLPDVRGQVELLTPLGFGNATVVVAVPQAWIDVRDMSDLDEVAAGMRTRHGRRLRVATKYVNLTRRFFAEKGVADYRIVESLGATEGAPAAGSAEIVVDITTTGATLSANALKVLDDGIILRSEANLVASLKAPWGEGQRAALRTVLGRIAAEERARTTREVRAALPESGTIDLATLAGLHEAELPYGAPRAPDGEIVLRCPEAAVFELAGALVEAGARAVTVRRVDYAFAAENPLAERLLARL